MPDLVELWRWQAELAKRLPGLRAAEVRVLAEWSLGLVLSRSCALSAVSVWWATAKGQSVGTVRQRLREWCYPAARKRGAKRHELDVESCFQPLLAWIVAQWSGQHLALALDATTLGDQFVVLALSVVYRGCAVPVAWAVVPAGQKGAWRPGWERLLRQVRTAVPAEWTVIVLADRGLYARWLFTTIVGLGWHPFLRVNLGGTFRPTGQARFRPFRGFVPAVDQRWAGPGTAFRGPTSRLACTLLAWHGPGYTDPWLILTDLPPEAADVAWYGLRAWIEQGFKVTKRAGWQWQRTRMTHPDRAARLWLAIAVATLWLVSVGGAADADDQTAPRPDLLALLPPTGRPRRATRLRLVGVFRRGWVLILVALLRHAPLPLPASFIPEPWPALPAPGPAQHAPAAALLRPAA
jgi:DDE family transposase